MLDEKISHDRRAKQLRLDNRLSEPMKYAICYIIHEYYQTFIPALQAQSLHQHFYLSKSFIP